MDSHAAWLALEEKPLVVLIATGLYAPSDAGSAEVGVEDLLSEVHAERGSGHPLHRVGRDGGELRRKQEIRKQPIKVFAIGDVHVGGPGQRVALDPLVRRGGASEPVCD